MASSCFDMSTRERFGRGFDSLIVVEVVVGTDVVVDERLDMMSVDARELVFSGNGPGWTTLTFSYACLSALSITIYDVRPSIL